MTLIWIINLMKQKLWISVLYHSKVHILFANVNLFTLYNTLMLNGLQNHPHAGVNRSKLDVVLVALYRMSACESFIIQRFFLRINRIWWVQGKFMGFQSTCCLLNAVISAQMQIYIKTAHNFIINSLST